MRYGAVSSHQRGIAAYYNTIKSYFFSSNGTGEFRWPPVGTVFETGVGAHCQILMPVRSSTSLQLSLPWASAVIETMTASNNFISRSFSYAP